MPAALELSSLGRIPSPGDNVAIAIRRIEVGTSVRLGGAVRTFQHTILEGHRFAIEPIAPGGNLLSWGLPFGVARRAIAPGEYVANQATLDILGHRDLAGALLPAEANFENRLNDFAFDPAGFRAAAQVARAAGAEALTFQGYRRAAPRGAGIRNYVVILGLTSRTAGYARLLAERLQPLARAHPSCDGIVAVGHTEGDTPGVPNNQAELLRTLAGFMLNPNVGAVLAVDYGVEALNHAVLQDFIRRTQASDRERAPPLADAPRPPSDRPRRGRGGDSRVDAARGGAGARARAPQRAADRAAVRRLRRLLGRIGQPADRRRRTRGDPPWRQGEPRRNRRAGRRRIVHSAARAQ